MLSEEVYGVDDEGSPIEPSERVRRSRSNACSRMRCQWGFPWSKQTIRPQRQLPADAGSTPRRPYELDMVACAFLGAIAVAVLPVRRSRPADAKSGGDDGGATSGHFAEDFDDTEVRRNMQSYVPSIRTATLLEYDRLLTGRKIVAAQNLTVGRPVTTKMAVLKRPGSRHRKTATTSA